AAGGRLFDVEVARRLRRAQHHPFDLGPSAEWLQLRVRAGAQELQPLRVAADDPGEPPRPGGERREALLTVRATELPVVHVEDTLVRHAPADVVMVTPVAVINGVAGGCARVHDKALQQGDGAIVLSGEGVS